MKTKKFEKRLELNKTTIADLAIGNLEKVKGGAEGTGESFCICPATNPTQYCPSCAWHVKYGCI